MINRKIILSVPENWTSTEKGTFFESFIASLILPMGYSVVSQLRFTGMEIDLLAKHEISNSRVFIECKAYSENMPADIISKLLGDIQLQKADAGWLFSTSDFSKDGKGSWEVIQQDPSLASKLLWYSPRSIIDLLVRQGKIKYYEKDSNICTGEETLIVSDKGLFWIIDVIENSLPLYIICVNAENGRWLTREECDLLPDVISVFPKIELLFPGKTNASVDDDEPNKAANVISGDSWEDPRPARPKDFVGRNSLLSDIVSFITSVKQDSTNTRIFTIEGPSGWGKSSLLLKVENELETDKTSKSLVSVFDTRSATNHSFVIEALHSLLLKGKREGFVSSLNNLTITSNTNPLESEDISLALYELEQENIIPVLIFDQFEELLYKQELLDTFTSIKNLCFSIDTNHSNMILGFAWKTDISIPQNHPAYYLWHSLSDRRKSFVIKEFGQAETRKVIAKAEANYNKKLSTAIKSRLIDQCQGFPWLLKKLLVHIFNRIPNIESQFELLENELDLKFLFEDDLSKITAKQIECIKFVAKNAPVLITEVDTQFGSIITNSLLQNHLIIRSGMNYSIYWDIFRDYLVENKLPSIPWNKTFQREPSSAIRLLQNISSKSFTLSQAASLLQISGSTCQNVIGDLLSLQIITSNGDYSYEIRKDVNFEDLEIISEYVKNQLKRHVVYKAIISRYKENESFSDTEWNKIFIDNQSRLNEFDPSTIHTYSVLLRKWLFFSRLLIENSNGSLRIPLHDEKGINPLLFNKKKRNIFLAASSPKQVCELIALLQNKDYTKDAIEKIGYRNALQDTKALGLVDVDSYGNAKLKITSIASIEEIVKKAILATQTIQIVSEDTSLSIDLIANKIESVYGNSWGSSSKKRYVEALKRFLEWTQK